MNDPLRTMRGHWAPFRGTGAVVCLVGCLGVFQVGTAAASPLTTPSPQTLLQRLNTAETTVQYSALMVTEKAGHREVAQVYRRGRKRRVEWLQPPARAGDLTVDDGIHRWDYRASGNQVVESRSVPAQIGLPSVPPGIPLSVTGPAPYEGRPAWSLHADGKRTLVIDAATGALLARHGKVWSFGLQNVSFGPVPPAKFVFVSPVTAAISHLKGTLYGGLYSARRAAPWLKAPATIPPGFRLDNAEVEAGGVWLRYIHGHQRFSLFEQKASGPDIGLTHIAGGWFWKKSGLRYLLTGAPAGAEKSLSESLR